MTRRGQPPAGLPGPRRGRPALRSDPGHHHRALAEQWPGRCSITPLGFCSNGQQVTTKTFFILESHGWVNQRRERTKTRGNLGRAALLLVPPQPHTPSEGGCPPGQGHWQSHSVRGHHDYHAMATCFSSKVAPQPIASGKTLLLEKWTLPGDDATSWGLTLPPSELSPKNNQRWEEKTMLLQRHC